MNLVRLRLLLGAWVVLAVAPGLVLGFTVDDLVDSSAGWLLAVWAGGFVAQFAVFMVAARVGNLNGSFLIWITASLGPFGVDWGWAWGWWLPVVFAVEIVAHALYAYGKAASADALQRSGVHARAEVLEVERPWMNVVVNNIYVRRTLKVRITREDGVAPYETTYKGLFELGSVPDQGDTFPVVVDPGRPQRIAYARDARHRDASRRYPGSDAPSADHSGSGYSSVSPGTRFTSWHMDVPQPESVGGSGGDGGRKLADQLQMLAEMHASGQLTDTEFTEAKTKLLGAGD